MAANKKKIPPGMFTSESEKKRLLSAMNTDQNEAERREIRQNYRQLQDELAEKKQDLIDPGDEENHLQQKLLTVDRLFANVKQAREGTLDSTSLVQIADLGMKKAQALQTDFVRFYPTDFCEKVRVMVAREADLTNRSPFSYEDWVRLGSVVPHLFSKTPVLRFMCGSFERGEVSLKKRTAKVEKEDKLLDKSNGKATKPTQLSKFETTAGGELTTAYVEHVLKILWNIYEQTDKDPVDFFEFVTHPTSFGQTVENIFYTSFLIRDGHAKISLDGDNLPVIEPIQKDENGPADDEASERKQLVLEITPAQWKQIVNTYRIEEPLIQSMSTGVVDLVSQASSSQMT